MSSRFITWLPAPLRARVEASETLRRLVPNAGWLLADKVARMTLGLWVSVWVARYLGPEDYGRFSFGIAFVVLFSPIATLGFERIAVRELVHDADRAHEVLGSAFAVRLVGGALACLAAVGVLQLVRPGDTAALTMVAIMSGVMVVQSLDVLDYWNQARMRARTTVLATSVAFLLFVAIRIALILNHAPLVAFAWAWAGEFAAGSLLLLVAYRLEKQPLPAWRPTRARVTQLLRDGWPLLLSGAMVMIYTRIDQILLRQLAGERELGVYAAAVRMVEVWYFLPISIVAASFPSIVGARKVNEELLRARMQKLYRLHAMIAYTIALPTTLLAPWIVRVLYGPGYERAAPMLAVLVWALLFTSLGVVRGAFLLAMNWLWTYLVTVAAGLVVNVLLNLWLIPRYGGMGAVIAACAASWVATHGSCILVPKLHPTGAMITRALLLRRS